MTSGKEHIQKKSTSEELEQRIGELLQEIDRIKERERELLASKVRYRDVFEKANDGIFISDPVTLRILDANRRVEKIYGYSRDELLKMDLSQLFPPEKSQQASKNILKLLRRGTYTMREAIQQRKDKGLIYVEISSSLIEYEGKKAVLGILRDITKRKRLEKRLQQSEAKFRHLVRQSLDGIFIIQDGLIRFANPEFQRMLGYPLEKIHGIPFWDLFLEEDKEWVKEFLQRSESGEPEVEISEVRLLRKDRSVIDVELNSVPIGYMGRKAIQGSIRDITKKKREAENQLQKEKFAALGEMASEIAHEIRNPLVSIGGFARILLRQRADDDPNRRYLEMIAKETHHLEEILSGLLSYVRPGGLELKHIDCNDLIRNALEIMELELSKSKIDVHLSLAEGLDPILIDRDQMSQVFINLFRNSIQAMAKGGSLFVATRKKIQFLEIEIRDTGTGIQPEHMKRLFEPFFTTKSRGIGLGMPVVKKIIDDHKGEIQVRSKTAKGTTFTIQIPYL